QLGAEVLADAEHAAAKGARVDHAGVVEADAGAELRGEQAAAGGERGAGGVELAALVAGDGGQRAAERQVGERLRLVAGGVGPHVGLRAAGAAGDGDAGGNVADLALRADVEQRVGD